MDGTSNQRAVIGIGVIGLVALTLPWWAWASTGPSAPRLVVTSILTTISGVVTIAGTERLAAELRRTFILLGWATVLIGLGEGIRVAEGRWLSDTTATIAVITTHGLGVVAAVIGLLGAPGEATPHDSIVRRALDATIVVAVSAYLSWVIVLDQVAVRPSGATLAVAVAGTAGGSAVIAAALVTSDRAAAEWQWPIRLAAFGGAVLGLESNVSAWLTARGLGDRIVNLEGAVLGGALFITAAAIGARNPGLTTRRPRRKLAAMIGPIAVAIAVSVGGIRQWGDPTDRGITFWGITALMLFSLVRQAVTVADNSHLTETLRSSIDALRHRATHDELTGLSDRHRAMERLSDLLAARHDGERVAVMYLDVDQFKDVNDTLGHDRGDTLLIEVARRVTEATGDADAVARFGGDEFLVVVCSQSFDDVTALADRIRSLVAAPMSLGGIEVAVTLSIGIAETPDNEEAVSNGAGTDVGITPNQLLRHADLALYQAKRDGRDRSHRFSTSLLEATGRRLELVAQLRRAVTRREFEVYYQPIIDLGSSRLIGAEALIRWNHPTDGVLGPDDWLATAEEVGLMPGIGMQTLSESCRRFAVLNLHRPDRPLRIAVNLSGGELRAEHLVDEVDALLRSSGLAPQHLVLEVSEQILGDDKTIETLHQLRRLGLRLSIDDFGTGYSALGQLRRFPVDEVKIDQSFVAGLGIDDADTTIVTAVCDLARGLAFEVVAEGVTTEAQVAELRRLGCPAAQGWHFGRAVPYARFVQLIERMAAEQASAMHRSGELAPAAGTVDEPPGALDRLR